MPTVNYSGRTFQFPDDATQDEIKQELNRYDVMNPGGKVAPVPNPILADQSQDRPIGNSPGLTVGNIPSDQDVGKGFAGALPTVGAMAGSTLGAAGAYPGAALGSVTKQMLQSASPETFGQAPQSAGDTVLDTAKDVGLNAVLPHFLTGAFGMLAKLPSKVASALVNNTNPAVKDWVSSNIEKFLPSETSDALELAKSSPTVSAPPAAQVTTKGVVDRPDSLTDTAIGDLRDGKPTKKVIDKLYGDPQEAQVWKAATGEPLSVEQLSLNKLISKNYSASKGTFNASKVMDEMDQNPDFFNEALRPETKANLDTFLAKAKEFEPEPPVEGTMGRILQYTKGRLLYHAANTAGTLAGAAVGSGAGPLGALTGGAGGIYLTNKALTKLMQSPTMGKLAIQALDTPADAPAASTLVRTISNFLDDTPILFKGSDGKLENGKISGGQVTLPNP